MQLGTPSPWLRRWRRLIVVLFVGMSLAGVIAGYSGSRVMAWQMFPEASRWEADIVRITPSDERVAISEPWPGGYEWSAMVTESGLSQPGVESHAAYGIDVTLAALQHALDWVATDTPQDTDTVQLEAIVRYRRNGGDFETITLRSIVRAVP